MCILVVFCHQLQTPYRENHAPFQPPSPPFPSPFPSLFLSLAGYPKMTASGFSTCLKRLYRILSDAWEGREGASESARARAREQGSESVCAREFTRYDTPMTGCSLYIFVLLHTHTHTHTTFKYGRVRFVKHFIRRLRVWGLWREGV